jgi:YhcH/YjgK/YiaL family protein
MIFQSIDTLASTPWIRHQPAVREAVAWVRSLREDAPWGITSLRGEEMYANLHGYLTLPEAECQWESHRHTADLQVCLAGSEIIQWAPPDLLGAVVSYEPGKDTERWSGAGVSLAALRMKPGLCALFMPGEPHRPMIRDGAPVHLRKVVVKMAASLFV